MTTRRPRVLELVRSLEKGGRTVRVLDTASRLRQQGFEVTLASFRPTSPEWAYHWPASEPPCHLATRERPDPGAVCGDGDPCHGRTLLRGRCAAWLVGRC